jgi:hypothetical protein
MAKDFFAVDRKGAVVVDLQLAGRLATLSCGRETPLLFAMANKVLSFQPIAMQVFDAEDVIAELRKIGTPHAATLAHELYDAVIQPVYDALAA